MINPETGKVYRELGYVNNAGYVVVPTASRHPAQALAHRVIWESVHGPIPEGLVINHLNGIRTDNRIANLECVTQAENNAHTFRIGRRPRGQPPQLMISQSRLTKAEVARIKAAPRGTITALAAELGIARAYAYQIRGGRRIHAETVLAPGGA